MVTSRRAKLTAPRPIRIKDALTATNSETCGTNCPTTPAIVVMIARAAVLDLNTFFMGNFIVDHLGDHVNTHVPRKYRFVKCDHVTGFVVDMVL